MAKGSFDDISRKKSPNHELESIINAAPTDGEHQPQLKRRRKIKRSPYTIQHNVKTRPGVKDIFQEAGDKYGLLDQETFEECLRAFLVSKKDAELCKRLDILIAT